MKKVIHVLASHKYSGAENVAVTIIKNTPSNYDAFYVSPEGTISEVLAREGIKYIPIDGVLSLKKVIHEKKPDIIHAHDYRASLMSMLCKGDAKIVSHLHSNCLWARKRNMKTFLWRFFLKRLDALFVVSRAILDEHCCRRDMIDKTTVLNNNIDLKKIYGYQCPRKTRDIDICFLGRLTQEKAPLTFIKCVHQLVKQKQVQNAVMIGDGELGQDCLNEIRTLNLESVVTMSGFLENPYSLVSRSKVLLMPSEYEGFGLAAMEAMSLAVPVVCTNVGGLKDFVKNGENGFLCSNSEELITKIALLLSDSALRETLGQGALQTAKAGNNIGSYINKMLEVYRRCLGES